MPRHPLIVGYTGRPELGCEVLLRGVIVVPIDEPADLVVSAAGSHIFTATEIARAPLGIVNLHLAPLPEYRGRYSATHAILNGERLYGVTLHYVDEGIDTGPIIAVARFPIGPDETAGSLRARALDAGRAVLEAVLPRLLEAAEHGKRLPAHPQDESRAHYYDRHSLPSPDPSNPLLTRALTC